MGFLGFITTSYIFVAILGTHQNKNQQNLKKKKIFVPNLVYYFRS